MLQCHVSGWNAITDFLYKASQARPCTWQKALGDTGHRTSTGDTGHFFHQKKQSSADCFFFLLLQLRDEV